MAGQAEKSMAKAIGEFQYPWREKLVKYKTALSKEERNENKRKGHKVDRIAAEKRENTARLMEKMLEMLLQYKKRRWEKKMKEEDKGRP
ncbi:hypothetical protein M0R45_019642 [Rubus argutus]|uniref:Uncharacterized protein n=1 Tax=Rubus argutus TaxID=59490 RepID=A0AAW1X7T5_RUBAR